MTIEQILLNCLISFVTAALVVALTKLVELRKWIAFALATFVLGLFVFGLNALKLINDARFKVEVPQLLLVVFLALAMIAIVLHYLDSPGRSWSKLRNWYSGWDEGRLNAGWRWQHATELVADPKVGGGLQIPGIPPLMFSKGYTQYAFTSLLETKDIGEQVAVYHIVHQKTYVSWVDAAYWIALRKIADAGFHVRIYISGTLSNDIFVKYVQAIAGPKVIIDHEVYDQFILANGESATTSSTSKKRSKQSKPAAAVTGYEKLSAFCHLLPLLLNRPQAFVLLWEGYHHDYVSEITNNEDDWVNVSIGEPGKNGTRNHSGRLSLRGAKAAFLLMPSAVVHPRGGEVKKLVPNETFLLGEGSSQFVYDRIKNLPNSSIRFIASELLASLLGPVEKYLNKVIVWLILSFRKEPFDAKVTDGKRDKVTAALAWLMSRANRKGHGKVAR